MLGAYYDIEIFANYVSFLFLDITTEQKWIDAYIRADINKDIEGKKYALNQMNYRLFIFHESQNDTVEFFEFIKGLKLLIGYNSIKFDDLLIMKACVLKDQLLNTLWWGIQRLAATAQAIIDSGKINYKYLDDDLKEFKPWWLSVDLLLALFETVSRKSLKQAGVNIKWYRIEDLPVKPESTITPDMFSKIFDYNMNDVLITRALHVKKKAEFELRLNIGAKYGVNVISSNRSTIADKLMIKFYCEYTGLKYYQFKDKRTARTIISFGDILNSKITFNTPYLKSVYDEIRNTVFSVGKEYRKDILFKNKGYTIATGGLHSVDRPGRFEVDAENVFLRDADVSSYYPRLIYNEGACPAQVAPLAFQSIVKMIMIDRLTYKSNAKILKKQGAEQKLITDAVTGAETLKIVANSGLFGKMGYDGWLYDPKAMYQVTLNGQLYLLMLIEKLEEAGIEVISANTDGVLARFTKDKLDDYNKITKEWQEYTKLELEFADYIKYVRTSVNSYLAVKKEWLLDKENEELIKRKDEFLIEVDLSKGFNAPIVGIALNNYFVHGIPIKDTICNHKDIYDYCISVKTGEVFDKQLHTATMGEILVNGLSKNLRYYVSTDGGTLLKHKRGSEGADKYYQMIRGFLITPFNDYFECTNMQDYNINYQYYIKRTTDMILKIEGEYSKPRTSRVYKGKNRKGISECGKMFDGI